MANTVSNIATGATTGATLGSIVPGIGTAIGAGLGVIGGAVVSAASGGAKGAYKRYVKDQFKSMQEQGSAIPPEKQREITAQMVEAQAQAQGAQDISQARRSIAQTGGGPITKGADTKTARDLGESTRSGAIKATAQARKEISAMDERKRSVIMQRMAQIADMEGAEAEQGRQTMLSLADAGSEIMKLG